MKETAQDRLPSAPQPPLARLTAPAGPPPTKHYVRKGADVLALPGRNSVTYLLLSDDGVVVIDLGSRGDVVRVLEALSGLGRQPEDVRYVVPTHMHFDHVMGLDPLALETGAEVALGRVAREQVEGRREPRWPPVWQVIRMLPTYVMQGAPAASLDDWRWGLDFGFPWSRNRFLAPLGPVLRDGEPLPAAPGWTVLETPGHADDALAFYHEASGYLIPGDTIRNYLGGEWNHLVCDAEAAEQSFARLLSLDVTAVFPGHGPVLEGPKVLDRLRRLPVYVP